MCLLKKIKVDSYYRIFQEKWTGEYFCDSRNGKALCLFWGAIFAGLKRT
jgi:hypothetical protein